MIRSPYPLSIKPRPSVLGLGRSCKTQAAIQSRLETRCVVAFWGQQATAIDPKTRLTAHSNTALAAPHEFCRTSLGKISQTEITMFAL
jgi:hypothetical protein